MVKIVQSLSELPEIAACENWVIDTETSGLSVHHGHRIAGIALCPATGAKKPTANDIKSTNTAEHSIVSGCYLPVRHLEVESAFSGSNGLEVELELESLRLDPDSSPPGPYLNLQPQEIFDWLRPLAADPSRKWVMHNAVFDLGMFRAEGVEFAGRVYDTMVLAHDIDSGRMSYGLDMLSRAYKLDYDFRYYKLVEDYLGKLQSFKSFLELGSKSNQEPKYDYSRIPIDLMAYYACEDVFSTGDLFEVLRRKPMRKAPFNFRNPSHSQADLRVSDLELVRVLFEMHCAGVRIDRAKILEAKEDAENQIAQSIKRMAEISGDAEFNPASPKQVEAAFVRAGGEIKFWTKSIAEQGKQKKDKYTSVKAESTGRTCWNAAALLDYLEIYREDAGSGAYQFLDAYRTCTQLQRVVTTYLDAYLKAIDCNDILHGNFDPTGTQTGRLSSRRPNLQNVTKPEGNADSKAWDKAVNRGENDLDIEARIGRSIEHMLTEFYRNGLGLIATARATAAPASLPLSKRIRSFFLARPGSLIVSIDYSSVEYRVAAYFSQDKKLIGAYVDNPELDFHQYCADIAQVPRSEAKTVNFGILYGMGISSLAALLRITETQAQSIKNRITGGVPAMMQAFNWAKDQGRAGFVQNPMGRVVKIPENRAYVALNYLVQGFCGDIMRAALIRVYRLIQARGWPILMMLTVHDEIVFDVPSGLVKEAAPVLAAEMCRVPEVAPLPITCDIEVGPNWGELVKFRDWVKTVG